METVHFPEILIIIYKNTQHHIPEDSNLHSHCHENLEQFDQEIKC
jgi:hypothetical protein